MLKFQTLDPSSPSVVALGRILAGTLGPRQLWQVEQRTVMPAWRSRSVSGIAYLAQADSGDLYEEDGQTLANLRTIHLGATTRCSGQSDPAPLYYVHVCAALPVGARATLYGEDGAEAAEEDWALEQKTGANPRLYVPSAGHWQVSFSGSSAQSRQSLQLRPVIPAWPGEGPAPAAGMISLAVSDTVSEKNLLRGSVDPGTTSPLLAISCDVAGATPCWVNVTRSQVELYQGSSEVPLGVIRYGQEINAQLLDLKRAVEAYSGWHAQLLAPRRVRIHASVADVSFLKPSAEPLPVPQDGTATIEGRCLFYATHQRQPFEVYLPPFDPQSSWVPRVSAGHLLSRERLDAPSRQLLEASLGAGYSIDTAVDVEWSAGSAAADVPSASAGLETLSAVDQGGMKWRCASRLINQVLDVWVGDRHYANPEQVFASVDRLAGTFITRFATPGPVRVRYTFCDDSLTFSGFRHPFGGAWQAVELNPRLQEADQRYQSQLLVLTPTRLTFRVTKDAGATPLTLVNPSPLRLVSAEDPYSKEQQLDGHWSTLLPLGRDGASLQLPWRVLAVLHYRPSVGPSSVTLEDVSRPGGNLRRDLSTAELARLSPAARSWDLLTSRKAHQMNQSLVLYLPRTALDRYSETEIRERAARQLPAATFFTIQWY